jgi:hypothetical protein
MITLNFFGGGSSIYINIFMSINFHKFNDHMMSHQPPNNNTNPYNNPQNINPSLLNPNPQQLPPVNRSANGNAIDNDGQINTQR